jgi:hypothetical protein
MRFGIDAVVAEPRARRCCPGDRHRYEMAAPAHREPTKEALAATV